MLDDSEGSTETLLADAARALFSGHAGMRHARSLPEGFAPEVWRELAGAGFLGTALPESLGGSGLGLPHLAVLCEEAGRRLATEPLLACGFLPLSLLARAAGENTAAAAQIAELLSGETLFAVAWQDGLHDISMTAPRQRAERSGGTVRLSGAKVFVRSGHAARRLLVTASLDGAPAVLLVEAAPGMAGEPRRLLDGTVATDLDFDRVAVDAQSVLLHGDEAASALRQAERLACLCLAAQLNGIAAAALERTLAYLRTRVQFGRPIGANQAVQHRVVDLAGGLALARETLKDALSAPAGDADEEARGMHAAKALAAAGAQAMCRACLHLHGGIGYADENDISLFLKAADVAAAWLGGAQHHRDRFFRLAAERVQ